LNKIGQSKANDMTLYGMLLDVSGSQEKKIQNTTSNCNYIQLK